MAATSGSGSTSSNDEGNGLLLYQFPACCFCQKVVLALHEKKLKFKSHIVDIYKGDQYQPWFMKLNPKAEVPVLKDGVKIIPDSNRIIDYLEDNFSNGDTPRLMPEKGSDQYHRMEKMMELLGKVPVETVTLGCTMNPHLIEDMKLTSCQFKQLSGILSSRLMLLEGFAVKYGEFKDQYESKKEKLQEFQARLQDVNEVHRALKCLEDVLDELEDELISHKDDKKDWWLVSEKFTIADITLAMLLNRLYLIGLWKRYFGSGKRPLLAAYFKRLQHRESFRKTMNQNLGLLGSFCSLGTKDKLFFSIGGAAVLLCLVGIGAYVYQRKK